MLLKPRLFSPANLSPSTVYYSYTLFHTDTVDIDVRFVFLDGGILGIDHTQSCETAYLPLSVANDRHCSPVHTSMQRGCTGDLCLKGLVC